MRPFALPKDVGHLPELGAILAAYPPDKRLVVNIPEGEFKGDIERGAEVRVGNRTGTVHGIVKRRVIEVEIDLATLEESPHEGQGAMFS